jgi:hypothetical protein
MNEKNTALEAGVLLLGIMKKKKLPPKRYNNIAFQDNSSI